METLSYDCGNPVQYVCGHSPAVLFYLLDRHASLAMTKGSKCSISYSLTTPPQPPTKIAFSRDPVLGHPSNGGELGAFPSQSKFPSAEGWHEVPGWSKSPLRRMGLLPQYRRSLSSPLRRGGTKCRGGLSPLYNGWGCYPSTVAV